MKSKPIFSRQSTLATTNHFLVTVFPLSSFSKATFDIISSFIAFFTFVDSQQTITGAVYSVFRRKLYFKSNVMTSAMFRRRSIRVNIIICYRSVICNLRIFSAAIVSTDLTEIAAPPVFCSISFAFASKSALNILTAFVSVPYSGYIL